MIQNSSHNYFFTLLHGFGHRRKTVTKPLMLFFVFMVSFGFPFIGVQSQTMSNPTFADAMAHIEKGQWLQAEKLLTSLLTQHPNLHRARLELGLTYIQLKKLEQAKQQFEKLLASPDVPDNVKQNIRQMMVENIDNENRNSSSSFNNAPSTTTEHQKTTSAPTSNKPHQIEGSVQLSVGYDDNVRYSASDYFLEDDPLLNGVFFDLEDGSFVFIAPDGFVYDEDGNLLFENNDFIDLGNPDRKNSFTEARINLNHQYQFDNRLTKPRQTLSWYNNLALQATDNQQLSSYNRLQMRLETGLTWQIAEPWKFDIEAHYRLLERDGKVQIRSWGIDPTMTYYNQWGSWTVGLQWMRREYEDSLVVTGELETLYEGFNNDIKGISGKWSRLFWDNRLLLLTRLELTDSNASDGFDYKGTRLTIASVYNFRPDLSLLLSASEFNQDYSELGDGPLDDDITTFRSKITYQMSESVGVFLSGERAIRTSDIYSGIKSDKTLWQLGVQLDF